MKTYFDKSKTAGSSGKSSIIWQKPLSLQLQQSQPEQSIGMKYICIAKQRNSCCVKSCTLS